ncbi:MAG: hypothetical protein LKJ44_03695 [Bifidobacteriaceae bacterium]|jgi:hypothetical protein|nr:hypothetical protein [Bifidobacteriaceae bacterium]MCI1978802.1 hypothetical protein [Bifidobacteriaceae bacterium]
MNTSLYAATPASPASATDSPAIEGLDDKALREAIEDFRIARASKERTAADEEFFAPLLCLWNQQLRHDPGEGKEEESHRLVGQERRNFVRDIAIAFNESLGMRDAMILSVVSELGEKALVSAGVNAAKQETARMVNTTLSKVFRSKTMVPDFERCTRALDLLIEVHTRVPRRYAVQPLAVMAYLLWWSGKNEEASGAALRCLSIDGECTLAGIVLSAIRYRISPAWQERARS